MQVFTAILAGVSMVGIYLNVHRDRRCFYIWIATNGMWVAVDVYAGLYFQAVLFVVYTFMAAWGLKKWKPVKIDIVIHPLDGVYPYPIKRRG